MISSSTMELPARLVRLPNLKQLLVNRAETGEKETVRVRRRRRSKSSGGEERERAAAPTRDDGQSPPPPRPPSGGGSGGSGTPSGGRPSGRGPKLSLPAIGLLLLLFLCIGPFYLFRGSDDGGDSSQSDTSQTLQSEAPATSTPAPAVQSDSSAESLSAPAPVSADGEGKRWLIMLYQDADDKILEKDIFVDLNEAERVGSSDSVHIVSQIDRFRDGYRGDGDWSSARRFYVTQDDDLERVGSQQVADLGEANMADANTLIDFVTWAVETYPADNHVLIMADHGMGWPGGWSDPTSTLGGDSSIPLAAALGDQLYLHELDAALDEIRSRTGLDRFELIGMDACLMGHLEVFSALAPHARYAVASQETEPALGWAYAGFLSALKQNPDMDGAELATLIIDTYIRDDQRVVDDQARADFVGSRSSAAQLTKKLERNITLTAADLDALPALTDSVNELSYALQQTGQKAVAKARSYAQSFTSIFGTQVPPSYVDLGNLAQLLAQSTRSREVSDAADRLLGALDDVVIAEKHGPNKAGATGISIYFPNSQLYRSPVSGYQSYTAIAHRFAEESLWDDFLAYHYTGRTFEPAAAAAVVPERSSDVVAPGLGEISVSPVTASSQTAAPGEPILLSIDISGENVGYVKLFAGFYDSGSNAIAVVDQDYLESDDTREVDGVYYPVWPEENEFTMEFEWEPIVFAIDDGARRVPAVFNPENYGAAPEDAVYTVDGTYTYADDGDSRPARLYFQDGELSQVFGFTGDGQNGAPREIVPQSGDQFTVVEQWMELDESGRVTQVTDEQGGTLTFGDQPLSWQDLDAAAGQYIVGFIIEDVDGNPFPAYTDVLVQ